MISTKVRTDKVELMDDFSMGDLELESALTKIANVNHILGGNRLTLDGVKKLLSRQDKKNTIKIIDIGCGNGDMLRHLADFAKKEDWKFELIGLDANEYTINHARKISQEYKNISYKCEDVFSAEFAEQTYDIALCTLTLHHFKNEQIESILKVLRSNAKIGIIINDLERSKIAYRLFQLYCLFFRLNGMAKSDGLISILRGFKREDLEVFAQKLNFKNDQIHWKWAFRYQWIIPTL